MGSFSPFARAIFHFICQRLCVAIRLHVEELLITVAPFFNKKSPSMAPFVVLLGILVAAALTLVIGLNYLRNYKPGKHRIQADLAKIKAEMQPIASQLIPWTKEELEQLSLNVINKERKKGMVYEAKGVFTTIYHEPVIAWYYRRYKDKKENSLLYVRTSNHEIIYRTKGDETEVVVNDQFAGWISADGKLYDFPKKRILAQIVPATGDMSMPVLINEKPVGALVNVTQAPKKVHQRALDMVGNMQEEEENMFLALTLLELVKVHSR